MWFLLVYRAIVERHNFQSWGEVHFQQRKENHKNGDADPCLKSSWNGSDYRIWRLVDIDSFLSFPAIISSVVRFCLVKSWWSTLTACATAHIKENFPVLSSKRWFNSPLCSCNSSLIKFDKISSVRRLSFISCMQNSSLAWKRPSKVRLCS